MTQILINVLLNQELKLHLDKALPEKFVVGVVKKELAADLFKKRFDLVSVLNKFRCIRDT